MKIAAVLVDGQDGGYSVEIFPSLEQAKEHIIARFVESDNPAPKTQKQKDQILEDEYENGYLSDETEVEIVDGKLTKSIYLHFGQ